MTIMEVDAFLADAAEAVDGKIYALGVGWNTIYGRSFPTIHPRVSLGITIHVPYNATNRIHAIKLSVENQDKEPIVLVRKVEGDPEHPKDIFELGGQFNVGRPPMLPPGDEQVVSLAMTINGMELPKPDLYYWIISIDDQVVKRIPMRVQLLSGQITG